MNTKRIIAKILLNIPVAMLSISCLGGFYAAFKKIGGISYASPIIMVLIIAGYFFGLWLDKKSKENSN